MKLLLTSQHLNRVGGQQLVIRDLSRGLRGRGHQVVAYSNLVYPLEDSLASDSVEIVTSLERLPFTPDIIHAQHHLGSMAALMALPGVPVVYCCAGATHTENQQKHPRIVRYVTTTPTLRLRMAIESGIDENLIDVVYNAVDLDRFQLVRAPPNQPRRALVYMRYFDPDSPFGLEVREAATRTGLELDFRGIGPNLSILPKPEEALLDYDIVFSSGKSAIDALACGCAVILLGITGTGEMVCEENFDRLRRANFTPAVNSPPPNAAAIVHQIENYSAAGAMRAARRLRDVANLNTYVDQMVAVYQRAIEHFKQTQNDLPAERRAAARYLRSLTPMVAFLDKPPADRLNFRNFDVLLDGLSRQIEAMTETKL
jgi:glycosyltransferase involved in cell wall biosynthesis